MRFYIDGYNLTHKISNENIKEMRVELLEMFAKFAALRTKHFFVIVWDGREQVERMQELSNNLSEVFTEDGSPADAYLIAKARQDEDVCIVSSDSKVFAKSANHGAVCIFAEEFLAVVQSVITEDAYKPRFRNKKNESLRQKVIEELI